MTKYALLGFWLSMATLIALYAPPEAQVLAYATAGVCVVVGFASLFVRRL